MSHHLAEMLAEGYPPAAMFMGVEGMNLETYNMLQTQHLQQVEQYWTMYPQGQATRGPTPVPTPTPPSRPHSTEHDGPSRQTSSSSIRSASSGRVQRVSFDAPLLTASPGAISLSSPSTHPSHPSVSPPSQAEPTRREPLQLNYNTVEILQDILDGLDEPGSTLDPPSSFPSPRRALSIASEVCDSDMDGGYASSTISTASSIGDGGPGGKYANWRKPSRKRRSGANGFRVDEEPPQVSIRTQSWASDGLGLGVEGRPSTSSGGAVEERFDWSAFLAQPASESPVVEDTVGPHIETLQADLPSPIDSSRASKRRKSVSDTAPFPPPLPLPGPLLTSLDAEPSSQVPGAHPWLPLARSISNPTLPFTPGDDPPVRSGPFSMALPKPPKLNSRSSFASSSAAGSLLSISPSKSLTSYDLSSVPAPPSAPLPNRSSHRASPPVPPPIRPPAQTRSAPGSIVDVQMAEGSSSTGASSRRRSLKIPGASTGFASPGQGLNPVVETNQEVRSRLSKFQHPLTPELTCSPFPIYQWVPSKPRIRKSVRRRLEKRRQEEGARTEHVLASSRPPPVVPLLEPPKKTSRGRRSKSKASSSGTEDGSEGSVGTEVGGWGKWRGKVQTGTEGETDESDEAEEDKPFEHGPTELPPRRTSHPFPSHNFVRTLTFGKPLFFADAAWAGKSPLELARKRKIPGSAMDKVRSLFPFFLIEPSSHALTTGFALLFERHTDPADRSAI